MSDSAIAALNSLLRGTSIDDHEEALKLANSAIKAAKGNPADLTTAQHTRVVALVKLDRFDDALRAIAEGGAALDKTCVMEKAYALYKTGELEAAEQLLETTGINTRGMKHLAAQVAYRAEKFDKAAELYQEMAENVEDAMYGEENDLRINILATYSQLEMQGKGWAVSEEHKKLSRDELEVFETAYNAACGSIAQGDFAKAAFLFKRARDLCEASEDLSEEDKKAELAPIIVQQAYVATKLGNLEEAARFHEEVVLSDISDASTRAIAQSNALILKSESNPYMAQRLADTLPVVTGNDRLFEEQATIFRRNKYIIELQAQKFAGVKSKTTKILSKEAEPTISSSKCDLGALNAAAVSELQTGKTALRRILPLLETRPTDVGLLLTVIQLYIQLQNPAQALNLLEAFFKRLEAATASENNADVRFAPGLVALAIALYRQQGRHSAVRSELAKAASHWQSKQKAASSGDSLLREAGIELLRSTHPSDLSTAGEAFTHLVAAQPDDRTATAGLIASFATSDFAKVQPYLGALSPVEKLTAGVDVSALLDAGVASLPVVTHQQQQGKKRAREDDGETTGEQQKQQQQAAKKQRRKRKLPKNYDPAKQPDPERWLPLRDRSSYRPKGRKGKKRAQEATQGGYVKGDEETLELAGGAGSLKVEKANPAGSGGGGGGGGGGKKKKKGKK
ncbi:hypothetical protein GE21DRAFT_8042 [Neurospora crassa]|uniref:Signal recognition particle subunit SRP72 n=2 Tax=Neurospora crassa TaxID=5141 RepID=A3RNH7_NEUCR|nr:signal recognition particle protein [Neurospora crassa OR74A]EAA26607.1 signal recognition particle protein [Neurospora crassa OR74A]KHE83677.1 hypothetical protein GE21DRAFT_8042 [Neurospora crassa]CAD70954.1 related to SIGNAL RECOGNITION PARTICLE 72 KDA PROTEIN [Neurospora crassa]|eukprot:XP_955843.1 signal recognition particle protein [Neurospora crassa OR74A]